MLLPWQMSLKPRPVGDDPENLTLVFLRTLDGKLDRLIEDMREVKLRLTTVESTLGNLIGCCSGLFSEQFHPISLVLANQANRILL
jgi:hypothetical protein